MAASLAVQSRASGRSIELTGSGSYAALAKHRSRAVPFYLKPTGLGTYMLYYRGGKLIEHWAQLDNLGLLRQIGVTSI